MQPDIGVLILAGGHSSRMEYPKAFLKNGESFQLENIIDEYRFITDEIYVTINHEFSSNEWKPYLDKITKKAHIIINHSPEKGRFFSIRLGMLNLPDKRYYFVHNVDN